MTITYEQNYEDILQDSCIYGSMIPSFKTHGLHQGGGPWKGNGLELFVQQLLLALTLISAQKCFSSPLQVRTNCINLASRNETTSCQLSCFNLLTLPHRITNKIFILQTNFSKTLAGAGLNRKVFTQVLGISRLSTYTHGATFREHLSFPPTSASITKT